MTKANRQTTVAEYIANKLVESGQPAAEVSGVCGFKSPELVAQIARGQAKLPFGSIHDLARALGADPAHLLRLALTEYLPDVWNSIERNFKTSTLSANERELVKAYRQVTGGSDATPVVIDRNAVLAIVVA